MVIHMVLNAVKMLMHFPTTSGISGMLSPRMLMTGSNLNYKKNLLYSSEHTARFTRKILLATANYPEQKEPYVSATAVMNKAATDS